MQLNMKFMRSVIGLMISFFIFLPISCKKDSPKNSEMKDKIENENVMRLLVGTYTNDSSKGIYSFDFDVQTGQLSSEKLLVEVSNPSYLTLSKNKDAVYVVNEDNSGKVSSFGWNADKTQLELLSEQPSEGIHPCYVSFDENKNRLAVANYTSGTLAVYPVSKKGRIERSIQRENHEGNGPVKPNQESAHVHCVQFDKNSNFLFAADLGIDKIISYPVATDGTLEKQQIAMQMEPGDGPRHFVFHPTKDMLFLMNELSNTVVSAKVDVETGILEKVDRKSTLPEDFTGENSGADIHISSDGKFLYATNRGHNSIAVFSVADDGMLNLLETTSVHGDWPRNFTLSPDENHILIANQNSNNITVFQRDSATGLLTYTNNEYKLGAPVCLKF
jgi:6-phosphogluconolactonase